MKNGMQQKNSATVTPDLRDLRPLIEKRAYEIWLNEGGGSGSDLDHWLQAERELAGLRFVRSKEAAVQRPRRTE